MKKVVAAILENEKGEILLLLRDNNPTINYPNMWDLIGGFVEDGEKLEEALVREVKEETGFNLTDYRFLSEYRSEPTAKTPNIKYIYAGKIDKTLDELEKGDEGQRLGFFTIPDALKLNLAHIIPTILKDYEETKNG